MGKKLMNLTTKKIKISIKNIMKELKSQIEN